MSRTERLLKRPGGCRKQKTLVKEEYDEEKGEKKTGAKNKNDGEIIVTE